MKTKEVKEVKECANVVVIANESDKLQLEVNNVYEFNGKKMLITGKRTHSEENPTTGKKTLWSGEIDGVTFTEVDVTKLRKLFGLAERKREKSAGKTFEHEGHFYSLDDTADAMIEGAKARYIELKSALKSFCEQYGIDSDATADAAIVAKIEAVCLARKVAAEKEAERIAAEKEAKAKANKEHRAKAKQAKSELFALLMQGVNFVEAGEKICEKYSVTLEELA